MAWELIAPFGAHIFCNVSIASFISHIYLCMKTESLKFFLLVATEQPLILLVIGRFTLYGHKLLKFEENPRERQSEIFN